MAELDKAKVLKFKNQILNYLNRNHAQVKTGKMSWNDFALNAKNLFRSYGIGTNPECQQAMFEVLSAPIPKGLENVFEGNYGLRTQAANEVLKEKFMEKVKKCKAEFGEEAAKAFMESNKCLSWAACYQSEKSKAYTDSMKILSDVIAKC